MTEALRVGSTLPWWVSFSSKLSFLQIFGLQSLLATSTLSSCGWSADPVQLQSVPEVWIRFCWNVLSFVKWDRLKMPKAYSSFFFFYILVWNLMWHLRVISRLFLSYFPDDWTHMMPPPDRLWCYLASLGLKGGEIVSTIRIRGRNYRQRAAAGRERRWLLLALLSITLTIR